MACVDSCRHGAIAIEDTIEAYTPVLILQGAWDVDCARKRVPDGIPIFVASSRVATGVGERYIAQNVIFVPGGLATAISEAFVASNGLVCSCAQEGGEFRFHLTSDADYLRRAQGSKYVKSNPLGAYREVRGGPARWSKGSLYRSSLSGCCDA